MRPSPAMFVAFLLASALGFAGCAAPVSDHESVTAAASSSAATPPATAAPSASVATVRGWAADRGWAVRRVTVGPRFAEKPVVYADVIRSGERRRAVFHLARAEGGWQVERTIYLGCGRC